MERGPARGAGGTAPGEVAIRVHSGHSRGSSSAVGPRIHQLLIFTYESLTQPPMVAGDDVLGRIVFRAASESANRARTLRIQNNEDMIPVILDGQTTTLDAFAIGRAFRPMQRWDTLSMSEFRDYLTDGMRAAREGQARRPILTMDVINPFPLLLGWPEGFGLTFFQPGQTFSDKAHPAPEKLFQNIDCVLVPKLPVEMAARNLLRATSMAAICPSTSIPSRKLHSGAR